MRGQQAENALAAIKPFLDELRGKYIKRMTLQMRNNSVTDTYAANSIVVLEDIEQHLRELANRGEAAARKLEEMALEAAEHGD